MTSITLRSALDEQTSGRNNLAMISPDILPMWKTAADPSILIASYNSFIAQEVIPEESNLVYTRGKASDPSKDASANVILGSFTNELIPWPQAINQASIIGVSNLQYSASSKKPDEPGVTAAATPVTFTPPGQGGRHEAFLAVTDDSFGKIALTSNYKDLIQNVGKPSTISLLNAQVADPVFDVFNLTTRLRFFDDSNKSIKLQLELEPIGIPTGFSVSIFSDNSSISLSKTALTASSNVGLNLTVSDGFDALITVQIYRNSGSRIPPDYSSISLVASVEQQSGHVTESLVVGAEHVVFDSSTRIARALVQGRLALGGKAQGFYFRDSLTDTDTIPRTGNASHSPDIQPLGTVPVKNIDNELIGDAYNTDVSDSEGVVLVSGSSNYVYLRGAANASADIELSLYSIPNNLLIIPDLYSQHGVKEVDESGNLVLATRRLTITDPGKYVTEAPFNLLDPPPPSTFGADHYCLIAEFRNYVDDPYNKPPWPHQDTFPTGADLVTWILGNPAVAWRNVSWTSNANAPNEIWQVNVAVDATWSPTDIGQLEIVCGNMPTGGSMQFQATAPAGSTVLDIGVTPISSSNQTTGVKFTGLQGPWQTTVTISWWQGGGAARTFGNSLSMQLQKVIGGMLAHELGDDARLSGHQQEYPLVVGPDYPHFLDKKRQLKLGHAHPLPVLPGTGRHHGHRRHHHHHGGEKTEAVESSTAIRIHPVSVVALGTDMRGVAPK